MNLPQFHQAKLYNSTQALFSENFNWKYQLYFYKMPLLVLSHMQSSIFPIG